MISVQENVSLREYSTFRVGGRARFFVIVKSLEDIREVYEWILQKTNRPAIFVLGGGSNILVSDKGFDGLVIKNEIVGVVFEDIAGSDARAIVGAGENWDAFVETCVNRGLSGIENLSYIPGTVGGAPVQNIGAYGAEVSSVIESVEAFDITNGEVRTFSKAGCEFTYRDSFFKKNQNRFIITRVIFLLKRNSVNVNVSYKDLATFFAKQISAGEAITPKQVRDAVISIRKNKLPDWTVMGTVGSFFKNPVITDKQYAELKAQYPELPAFPAEEGHVKIPLAWILDNVCGYRGKQYTGAVGVYKNQALVLINDYAKDPNATAEHIRALADEIVACVKEKTGLDIEPEAQYIGF